MPGPPPKPPDKRQRRRPDLGVIHGGPPLEVPDMPPAPRGTRWLRHSREWWERTWSGRDRRAWTGSDSAVVERLLTLVDERERARRGLTKGRLVPGASGQPVLNPLAGYLAKLDAGIRQLEDRLGLSPRSRLQLGVTLGDAHRLLRDLMTAVDEDDEDDPRFEAE